MLTTASKERAFYMRRDANVIASERMTQDIRFYKGKHKVKVLSESPGHWTVEALETFEDLVNGEKVKVKIGERRIVTPNLLFKREGLAPPVKEHAYELKMEKRLKKFIETEKDEKKQQA